MVSTSSDYESSQIGQRIINTVKENTETSSLTKSYIFRIFYIAFLKFIVITLLLFTIIFKYRSRCFVPLHLIWFYEYVAREFRLYMDFENKFWRVHYSRMIQNIFTCFICTYMYNCYNAFNVIDIYTISDM